MQNMEKGLSVPKWMLVNRLKVTQMPQNPKTPKPHVID